MLICILYQSHMFVFVHKRLHKLLTGRIFAYKTQLSNNTFERRVGRIGSHPIDKFLEVDIAEYLIVVIAFDYGESGMGVQMCGNNCAA